MPIIKPAQKETLKQEQHKQTNKRMQYFRKRYIKVLG
jgi:hypothetical protein